MLVDIIQKKKKGVAEIVNIVSDLVKFLEFLHYDVEKVSRSVFFFS